LGRVTQNGPTDNSVADRRYNETDLSLR